MSSPKVQMISMEITLRMGMVTVASCTELSCTCASAAWKGEVCVPRIERFT